MTYHPRLLILALLAFSLALVGYVQFYRALERESAAARSLAHEVEAETGGQGVTLERRLAEITEGEQLVRPYFVSEGTIVSVLTDLRARGAALGTTVSATSVRVAPTPELALAVTGTFDAVMRTIGALEYAPYALSLSALSLTEETGTWRATLALVGPASELATSTAYAR